MTEPTHDAFEFVGDSRELPPTFYMAVAKLLLSMHDADKTRAKADAEKKEEEQ